MHWLFQGDLAEAQWGWALNGAVVGLASTALIREAAAAGAGAGAGRVEGGEGSAAEEEAVAAAGALLPCLGVGLVRAVDMRSRELFLLSPVAFDDAALQTVDCLLVRGGLACTMQGVVFLFFLQKRGGHGVGVVDQQPGTISCARIV